MGCDWQKRPLGQTGVNVSGLGLASSYGLSARDVERGFERGINYFYWGSRRRSPFGEGVRNLAKSHREQMAVVIQSYTRAGILMRPSLELALRRLKLDYADFLLLGWWNVMPPKRILDAALALKAKGLCRHIMVSCHERPLFRRYFEQPEYEAVMVRYNAAHPGAEEDAFPHLPPAGKRPGVIAYTATRWGGLLDAKLTPASEPKPRGSDCYRFALSNPNVDLVLVGASNGAELDEACAALDRGPMSADELSWMKRVGAHVKKSSTVARGAGLNVLDSVASFLWKDAA